MLTVKEIIENLRREIEKKFKYSYGKFSAEKYT